MKNTEILENFFQELEIKLTCINLNSVEAWGDGELFNKLSEIDFKYFLDAIRENYIALIDEEIKSALECKKEARNE